MAGKDPFAPVGPDFLSDVTRINTRSKFTSPGKIPFFITGAVAKIKVDGVTMAMCVDVGYSIRVKHANAHVLGVFESFSNDPLTYEVTGSFTVIRYTKGLKSYLEDKGFNTPENVGNEGNGIGSWHGGNQAKQSMDPGQLYRSGGFDIEIQQKANGDTGIIARLRNCRIIGSDFKLSRRGVATQTFTFQANYADEDTFNATESGVGQTLV